MRKPLFLPSSNPILRLLLYLTLSVTLIYLDQRTHQLDNARSVLNTLIYPLQVVVDFPARAGSWFNETLVNRSKLIEQNTLLRAENLQLSSRLRSLDSLKYENRELQTLLNTARQLEYHYTLGRILAVSMNKVQQRVIIDKGSKDGIQNGIPLLDGLGLMGEITRVYPYHAEAILISDTSEAIPVRILRNGIRGILTGTDTPTTLDVLYFPVNADIRVGDMLVTSGLGGRFPPDLPVANISQVSSDSGSPFVKAEATPLAALNQSRSVLMISPATKAPANTQTEAIQ